MASAWRCRAEPNHDGLESAEPDLQSVFKKPAAYEGRSLARARTTIWETLRCFLTPADGVGSGGYEEVPPGPWPRGDRRYAGRGRHVCQGADERKWAGRCQTAALAAYLNFALQRPRPTVASSDRRTKPLRGGEDRDLGKGSASATRPTDSDVARRLNRRATSCYSPAWRSSVLTSVSAFALRRAGTPPGLRPLPIYSIYIKAKAVPVAASFSAVVSARPMRPDVRPRSVTALRIQDSSITASFEPRESLETLCQKAWRRPRSAVIMEYRASFPAWRVRTGGMPSALAVPPGQDVLCPDMVAGCAVG